MNGKSSYTSPGKVIISTALLILVLIAGLLPGARPVSAEETFDITFRVFDTDGREYFDIPVRDPDYPTPATFTVYEGQSFGFNVDFKNRRVTSKLTGLSEGTTYTVNATGEGIEITSEPTPGVNQVRIVFEIVDFTARIFDTEGKEYEGIPMFIDNAPSPWTGTMANGGRRGVAVLPQNLKSREIATRLSEAFKDTVYTVDATGEGIEIRSEHDPGGIRINVLFEHIDITFRILDTSGIEYTGIPILYPHGPTPCTLRKANGSYQYLHVYFDDDELVYVIRDIFKDTTYTVLDTYDGPVKSSEPTPGVNEVRIVFGSENALPILDPIGDKVVNEGEELSFPVTASDPDAGDVLTFSASNLPDGASFMDSTFSWTPTFDQSGLYTDIRFEVSDGTAAQFEDITITVNNVNRRPVLDPPGDQTVDEGELLQFTLVAFDPDSDSLTYSALDLPDGAFFDAVTQTFFWIPDYASAGTYENIHFEVSDGDLSDYADITITVNDVPPELVIERLIGSIREFEFPHGVEMSLISKLEAAIHSLERDRDTTAINQLEAFIHYVEAQTGKKLTDGQANELTSQASIIIEIINGLNE